MQFLLLNGNIFRKNEGASTAKFTWTESLCLIDDTSEVPAHSPGIKMKVFEFNPETGLSEGLKFSGGHVQSRLPGLLEVPGGQLRHPPGASLASLAPSRIPGTWHYPLGSLCVCDVACLEASVFTPKLTDEKLFL